MLYSPLVIFLKVMVFMMLVLGSFVILAFTDFFLLQLKPNHSSFLLIIQFTLLVLTYAQIIKFQFQNPGYTKNPDDELCKLCRKHIYGFHHHCFVFQQDISIVSIKNLRVTLNQITIFIACNWLVLLIFIVQQNQFSLQIGVAIGGIIYGTILPVVAQYMGWYFQKLCIDKFNKYK
ncbi:Transmembrane domain-containing protein [Spironucleus salmonicida]|uniref:Transmembrane domain-containing protein n=1 Tax=Spironucleus salmonicida TaxID=348837 RepID=A0A9P8LLK4_9EUKA|nr:Transmembrane domain-containing protein [Spironucleus salmonicida]